MNTSSQTLRTQSSPILLLAQLLADNPELPAATYQIDSIVPGELVITLHRGRLERFEDWRIALGLDSTEMVANDFGGAHWADVKGRVQDVPVRLTGHGTADEVAALVKTAVAA
ncbi:hypothetical protein ACFYNN_13075 [Streptomyces sp. NPDC006978]|uniref:hypothetical protein n=1 Tax=Streptomyces sp. NPDC006978 TaxID=3364769 RepID=UPI0036AAEE5B